jgi:putative IMPACT (imprinted ancient) family translation regulator
MLDVLRHQDLEGVLATVVRYFGGVKLGAGGLVRAYTDCVAQALLTAQKVPLQRMSTLACSVPYSLEGWLRREIEAAGAELLQVEHGSAVTLQWRLPQAQAAACRQRISDGGQGRVGWMEADGTA